MIRRVLLWAVGLLLVLPLALVLLYRIVPPPATPLMLIRQVEGEGLERRWVPLAAISPGLAEAVIAAEDNLFCRHHGFDWKSLGEVIAEYEPGEPSRGASTITMQTAKNLFLWPARSFVRKAAEAWLTVLLELAWDKRRILEVYLNVVEWGPGLYGAEAAARRYFGKAASRLSRRESALLAAVLPNPRRWSPADPTDYIARRARVIATRVGQLGPLLACAGRG